MENPSNSTIFGPSITNTPSDLSQAPTSGADAFGGSTIPGKDPIGGYYSKVGDGFKTISDSLTIGGIGVAGVGGVAGGPFAPALTIAGGISAVGGLIAGNDSTTGKSIAAAVTTISQTDLAGIQGAPISSIESQQAQAAAANLASLVGGVRAAQIMSQVHEYNVQYNSEQFSTPFSVAPVVPNYSSSRMNIL